MLVEPLTPTQYAAHLALSRHDARARWHTEHLVECIRARDAAPGDAWAAIALDVEVARATAFLEEGT